jgi:hypothetical protein
MKKKMILKLISNNKNVLGFCLEHFQIVEEPPVFEMRKARNRNIPIGSTPNGYVSQDKKTRYHPMLS